MRLTPPGNVYFPRPGDRVRHVCRPHRPGTASRPGSSNSDGSTTPIHIDEEFLSAWRAHLNVTGVSGLATKTSYIEFLLRSSFAHSRRSIAVVCFNVKGPDLLFLDKPNVPTDPALQARYRRMA